MTRLFKRKIALTVAKVKTDRFWETRDAVTFRDMRVSFSIEKALDSAPNRSTVTIQNLSEQTRGLLTGDGLQAKLLVGYDDGVLAQLFVGDVIKADHAVSGANWVTKLFLREGGRAHKHARVERSYKAGVVDPLALLKETAASMGLKLPKSGLDASKFNAKLASGVVLSGPSHKEMTRLLDQYGYGWSIQDNTLQILAVDGATAEEPVEVSVDTGMTGVPEYSEPDEEGKPPTLKVSKKIDPAALPKPGRLILMNARRIKGLHVVKRVVHVGDNEGQEWRSDMEAVAA